MAVLFSLFCLYVTLFANFMEQVRLSSFLGALIVIGYLTYPAKKGKVHVNAMPWYDIVLMVLGAGAFFFYVVNAKYVVKLNMRITKETVYIVAGLIGLLSLAELCRRSVGLPILCVAGIFVVYTVVNQWNEGRHSADHLSPVLWRRRRAFDPHQRLLEVYRRVHHFRRVPRTHGH